MTAARRPFVVRRDDLSGQQTRELLALHLAGVQTASPPGSVFALDLSGLQDSRVTVWTAWAADRVAGIGALKMLPDGNGEIKSMRTHPDFLRKGAAAQILNTIIEAAVANKAGRLSLETGTGASFEPAMALYRRFGFQNGEPFSDYEQSHFNQFLHLKLD